MSEVIKVECPCGAVFSYNHGNTETGERLATEFITRHYEHKSIAKVTQLDLKPTDWVINEYVCGSVDSRALTEMAKTFCKVVSRCEIIGLNPGRGDLKFTVARKEKETVNS